MQLTALIPLLALLATPAFSRASPHPHAAAHRRHLAKHDRISNAVEQRREALAETHPRALAEKPTKKKRKVNKRGASGCRAKNATTTTSAYTESATESATSDIAATSSESVTEASSSADAVSSSSSESVWVESTSSSSQAEATSSEWTSSSIDNVAAYDVYTSTSSEAASSSVYSSDAGAASSTSASASATTTSSAATTSSTSSYTPNGNKAGIAGGDAYDYLESYLGWWYDWNAVPTGHTGTPVAVNMLWGAGSVDSTDASRLAAFEAITDTPEYIIGFEEPDCSTSGSSNIAAADAAILWDSTIAPWQSSGSILVSPSMCHQAAEEYTLWLATFSEQITTDWDITNLHINKNSMDGVNADLDYYYNTYGKPIWVTEFACVDDSTDFVPCTDQDAINTFINEIVELFENDDRVYAYAYSNGEGLSDEWSLYSDGALSESGETYLAALANYH